MICPVCLNDNITTPCGCTDESTLAQCTGCRDYVEEETGGYFHGKFYCAPCKADNEEYEANGIFSFDEEKENASHHLASSTIQ